MDDVLGPVCKKYGVNYVTFVGEVSITAVSDLAYRIMDAEEKPTRIFYVSDFDPAGQSMPVSAARKLEFMIDHYEILGDVRLTPLFLTAEQIAEYNLPRKPIKASEKRAGKFREAHGAGAVELDALEALHPGEMARILEQAILEYYDRDIARETNQKIRNLRAEVRVKVDAIVSRYAKEIAALEGMIEELKAIDVDCEPYEVHPPEFDDDLWAEETGHFLYTSHRTYFQQIASYKMFKAGEDYFD